MAEVHLHAQDHGKDPLSLPGKDLHLAAIYRKIRKPRGRAKILASILDPLYETVNY
jgi:hypothetical protein